MSSSWIHGLANAMRGSTLKNSGIEKACVKVMVLPMPAWKTDSNSTIWVVTKCPKTGVTYDLECEPTETVDSEWACRDMNAVGMKKEDSKSGSPKRRF